MQPLKTRPLAVSFAIIVLSTTIRAGTFEPYFTYASMQGPNGASGMPAPGALAGPGFAFAGAEVGGPTCDNIAGYTMQSIAVTGYRWVADGPGDLPPLSRVLFFFEGSHGHGVPGVPHVMSCGTSNGYIASMFSIRLYVDGAEMPVSTEQFMWVPFTSDVRVVLQAVAGCYDCTTGQPASAGGSARVVLGPEELDLIFECGELEVKGTLHFMCIDGERQRDAFFRKQKLRILGSPSDEFVHEPSIA